jgi:hypothetical protein
LEALAAQAKEPWPRKAAEEADSAAPLAPKAARDDDTEEYADIPARLIVNRDCKVHHHHYPPVAESRVRPRQFGPLRGF